jgi:hypothetical protein
MIAMRSGMSHEKGWQDLRRRLPSLDRAYVRQRRVQLAARSVVACVMAAAVIVSIVRLWTPSPGRTPSSQLSPAQRLGSSAPTSRAEASSDAMDRIEARGQDAK